MKQLLMVCCAAVFSTAVAKTYYVNPVTAADGDKTITFTNAAAENEVSFAYKGAGNALLHDFVPPVGGSLLMVR